MSGWCTLGRKGDSLQQRSAGGRQLALLAVTALWEAAPARLAPHLHRATSVTPRMEASSGKGRVTVPPSTLAASDSTQTLMRTRVRKQALYGLHLHVAGAPKP